LTFWPPAPWARMAVISTSSGGIVSGMGGLSGSRRYCGRHFPGAERAGCSAIDEPE
jgi:hypothetical protein